MFPVCHIAVGMILLFATPWILSQDAGPLAQARSLAESGELDKSQDVLHGYLANHAESADAHFLLGYVLFRERKAVQSLAEFTVGARVRRPKADELKTVASDYVLLGDFHDADKWFTAVTAETPNDPDAWYLLGRTKYNENRFSEAVSSFERALALHPNFIEAENNLGLALRETSKPQDAKAAFQTAIDWEEKHAERCAALPESRNVAGRRERLREGDSIPGEGGGAFAGQSESS